MPLPDEQSAPVDDASASGASVPVWINGVVRPLTAPTLRAAMSALDLSAEAGHVAIAVNDSVVPRARWHTVTLGAHDRVEIITAVAGG